MRLGALWLVASLVASLVAVRAHAAPEPAFEWRALGVLGGDTDANLSSFVLTRAGHPEAALLLDGGTVVDGAGRLAPAGASPTARAQAALALLATVKAALLTHAHLDHTAGLVTGAAPLLLGLPAAARPLEVVGLPETLEALARQLLAPPAWVDWTKIPADHPTLRLSPLAAGATRAVGPFTVRALPLRHTIPCAAYLVTVGDAHYLHLGDTGPSDAVWQAARPLVGHGLRAVTLEASFPSDEEPLALGTGHLTPRLLLLELAKLAGVPNGAAMTRAALVTAVRRGLPGVRVVVVHLKARSADQVTAELAALRAEGLDVVVPSQGETLRF